MNTTTKLAGVMIAALAFALALPTAAQARVRTYGDTRPCVTEREFNHIGGLHQTRADVRRIVDSRGVVVSNHTFDTWGEDAGLKPRDMYATAPRFREIRRYAMCPEMVARYGGTVHFVYVEYRVRYGTTRVEQAVWN